jgi:integrase/recombinase XerD
MDNDYLKPFKIHLLKQKEEPLKFYSDDDIQKLIAKPNVRECSFVEYLDWVMINYFIETGNRLRSVINIKVSDIDFTGFKVLIRETKNREILTTPLTKTLLNILPQYTSNMICYRKVLNAFYCELNESEINERG